MSKPTPVLGRDLGLRVAELLGIDDPESITGITIDMRPDRPALVKVTRFVSMVSDFDEILTGHYLIPEDDLT